MLEIFENDMNTKIYGELSELSAKDTHDMRLNPLRDVQESFQKTKAPFIILKPLVESQNIRDLLEYFKGSKALWMFRNYKDVALSNLNYFGMRNGINDIRPIAHNTPGNWRSEAVSDEVREIIRVNFSDDMNPYDAAVLFWYARNSFFFDLKLDQHPDIFMCAYEDLVTNPKEIIQALYRRCNQTYPGSDLLKKIHTKSLHGGQDITLSAHIKHLAEELLDKLEAAYQTKKLVMDR